MAGDDLPCIVDQDRVGEAERSMLAAIWWICFFECVRALFAYGRNSRTDMYSIFIGIFLILTAASDFSRMLKVRGIV